MHTMNKEQQKDGKLLHNIFVCYYNIVIIPLSHGRDNYVDQSTDGSSNLPGPFQTSQYPNGEVPRDDCSIRLSPGHAHFL